MFNYSDQWLFLFFVKYDVCSEAQCYLIEDWFSYIPDENQTPN